MTAQAKWFSCLYVCGHAGAAPDRPGEKGAEPQRKAHNLSVYVTTLTFGHELLVVTKGRGRRSQWLKLVSPVWWLGLALEIGGGARASGRRELREELHRCSLVLKEAN